MQATIDLILLLRTLHVAAKQLTAEKCKTSSHAHRASINHKIGRFKDINMSGE